MTHQVQSIEFFKAFVEKQIEEKIFIEELQKLTTQIQQRLSLNNDQLSQIFTQSKKIDDGIFNSNIELFIKFAMFLADRDIYQVFQDHDFNFQQNYNNVKNLSINEIALYIIGRVIKTENPKVLLLFLNGFKNTFYIYRLISQVRQIEKKYVLLEFYIQILPILNKRELHFQDILPLLLKIINEGLEKYFQYVKQQKDGVLNEKNLFVNRYLKKFQTWTASILVKIFKNLKLTPEIKIITKQKVIQELFSINELYDYDYNLDQIFMKPENPTLGVKHLVLLFVFDLIQGILEAKISAETNHLEPKLLDDLYDQIIQFLNEIHSNKLELIENYLQFVRFSIQRDIPMTRQILRYEIQFNYNPVSIAHFTHQVLFENRDSNHNLQREISLNQKLNLSIGVLYEQKFIQQARTNVQDKLIYSIGNVLANIIPNSQIAYINKSNYFITPLHKIILLLLEKAGSGLKKEDESMYISAQQNLASIITIECYTVVILESLRESDNILLLAHLINHYRSVLQQSLKSNQIKIEESMRYVDVIHNQIQKKIEVGTIDTKIQIVDSIILLQKTLMLNYNSKIDLALKFYQTWRIFLNKFEKDIQQSLDYLNQKKIEKEKANKIENQDGQLVYQQLLNQENVIQIVYYNLQDLISLYQN